MSSNGIAVGLNKGYQVTKRELPAKPVNRKGALGKRVSFIREIIREVTGFTPYERRMLELLKVGKDKRALKVAKKRLGTHRRSKSKREEMQATLRAQRSAKK
eukprot:GFYU01000462.1.p3 GENE.GFYU01000462.1~~GFYU01000462.1.p3  ORF type:complete len:116 (-),score=33.61 GFYU01000462.1:84-389(-)